LPLLALIFTTKLRPHAFGPVSGSLTLSGMIARARRLAEQEDVRVEWHQGDLADLAFLRAESIDLAFSAFAYRGPSVSLRALNRKICWSR